MTNINQHQLEIDWYYYEAKARRMVDWSTHRKIEDMYDRFVDALDAEDEAAAKEELGQLIEMAGENF